MRSLKESEISRLESALRDSRRQYNNLMTARMLELSDTDIKESRQRITRLVREVNKCIRLLSAESPESFEGPSVSQEQNLSVSSKFSLTELTEDDSQNVISSSDSQKSSEFTTDELPVESPKEQPSEEPVIDKSEESTSESVEETSEESVSVEEKSEASASVSESVIEHSEETVSEEEIAVEEAVNEDVEGQESASDKESDVDSKVEVELTEQEIGKDEKDVSPLSKAKKGEVDPWDFGMLPLFPDDEF